MIIMILENEQLRSIFKVAVNFTFFTLTNKHISRHVVHINITPSPESINVFLPAFSIKIRDMMVIATFMPPIPSVADCAS